MAEVGCPSRAHPTIRPPKLSFRLSDSGESDVMVCDVLGRVVFSGWLPEGEGIVVPSGGVYVVRVGTAVGRIYARP
ncbi:MAG: hypothetical protein IJ169_05940 [Paludibacteraceae bacterium]|nr:hypothetical protein [Paludibacteraceae bacterium]